MKHEFNGYTVEISDNGDRKITSENFNMLFRKSDGFTAKWGKTKNDDPTHCPWGSEIADIEITTACSGIRGMNPDGTFGGRKPCECCYKSNQPNGKYMTFNTFKTIFDKISKPMTLTQIAFGVDAECKTNPDVWKIMDYCIENNVTPNVTVADIDEETARNIVSHCGACAVSVYERNKNCCYDSVKLLVDEAMRQNKKHFRVNIHLLVSHETEEFVFEVLNDRLTDGRLKNMGAIVLLSLKQKGRGKAFSKMDDGVYQRVIDFLQDNHIAYGSDSCGANRLTACLKKYYSPENYVKRIARRYAYDGKYWVFKYNNRRNIGWSGCPDARMESLYYMAFMESLDGVPTSQKQYALENDAVFINDRECILPNAYNYDKLKHMVVRGTDNNNGVQSGCYHQYDLSDMREVPYEYLERHFMKMAEEECQNRLSNAIGSIEACESFLYSQYINADGEFFPCSFMEGEDGWEHGIDLKSDRYRNFTTQVWNHPRVLEWRNNAIRCINCNGCNQCPHYEI